jgi:propionyl-CoA synthetase
VSLQKGVVRDTGGHAVALTWAASNVYDINAGDRWWAASDMAWVVGSSWICWGPLLAGATTTLYEGKPVGTPDAGAFWRVCSEWGIKAMFTAPTAIRAVKKEDPQAACKAAYPMPNFKTLFLAGERSDPDTIQWAERALSVPVLDNWCVAQSKRRLQRVGRSVARDTCSSGCG